METDVVADHGGQAFPFEGLTVLFFGFDEKDRARVFASDVGDGALKGNRLDHLGRHKVNDFLYRWVGDGVEHLALETEQPKSARTGGILGRQRDVLFGPLGEG